MTWITDIKNHIEKKYSTTVKVVESSQTRYKFQHRAVFNFYVKDFPLNHLTSRNDFKCILVDKLQDQIKIRSDWTTTFVYFNDIDQLMSAVPAEYFLTLDRLEIMHPNTNAVIEQSDELYPVIPLLKKKLPHNRYRYRILCNNRLLYTMPKQEVHNLCSVIESYEGVRLCNNFKYRWRYDEKYFYAESLEWLALLIMIEPRLIRQIQRYVTPGELELETTD